MYGNPEITSGGNALKYYASVRIDVRKKENIVGEKGEVVGVKTRAKVVKNKVGVPYRCVPDVLRRADLFSELEKTIWFPPAMTDSPGCFFCCLWSHGTFPRIHVHPTHAARPCLTSGSAMVSTSSAPCLKPPSSAAWWIARDRTTTLGRRS